MTVVDILKHQFNLRVYEEGSARIEKVLGFLTEEEVWYKPNDQSNSIGQLVLHLCGNVTQWIGSGIGGEPDIRTRDAEFAPPQQYSKAELSARLKHLRPITDRALATINTTSDLTLARSVQGFDETVLGIAIHVIEHFSYHTGQIAIIAKYLKGMDLGFYADMDLNVKNG